MNLHRTIATSLFATALAAVTGCSGAGDPQGSTTGATGASETQSSGTLLASVDKGNGHVIEFRLDLAGALLVVETAPLAEPPVLTQRAGKTASELYRIADPGAPVPAAIAEADARAAAQLKEPAVKTSAPPADEARKGDGPALYNAGQQAWFKSTYCVDNTESSNLVTCLQGYSWVHLGWNYGMQYQAQFLNGSEGQTATVTGYNWVNGASDTVYTGALVPGQYRTLTWPVQSPQWHTANMDNAGANTQVSGAADNCGEADQWSCTPNCGSCDPEVSGACEIVGAAGQSYCLNGNGE